MFAIPTNRVRGVLAALRQGSVRARLQEQGRPPRHKTTRALETS
ncbi:Uncharacterised protein [Bordetella pertussis]|nr:Uncharacterised protein [Bordetella pertussis]